jgi:hypothetical protein
LTTIFKRLTNELSTADADDLSPCADLEQVSFGKRQLTWSLGVHDPRKLASLGEQTDEEIAAEDFAGEDTIALPSLTWEALLLGELTTDLLDAAELAGIEGACTFLTQRGLDFLPVVMKCSRVPPLIDYTLLRLALLP